MISRKTSLIGYALLLLLLILILRSPSYDKSVIDWDESMYLLGGDNILHGGILYKDFWDYKGPLLYLIFAFIIKVTGHSMLGLRLFTCVWIWFSALLIFFIGKKLLNKTSGVFASIFFVVATSCANLAALASNSEIFFLLPVLIGAYIILFLKSKPVYFFIAGISLGLAFNINIISIFHFLPLLLFILIMKRNENGLSQSMKNASIFCLGFLTPLFIFMAYFYYNGLMDKFMVVYFSKSFQYIAQSFAPGLIMNRLSDFLYHAAIVIWGICLLAVLSIFAYLSGFYGKDKKIGFLILWSISVLLGIVLHGRFFTHLFIQELPAICLLGGIFIGKIIYSKVNKILVASIIILISVEMAFVVQDNIRYFGKIILSQDKFRLNDTPARISDYVRPNLSSSEYIYVPNYEPIIYFLTKAKIPTKYSFPLVLMHAQSHEKKLGINAYEEVKKILSLKPSYIILRKRETILSKEIDIYFNSHLEENYQLDKVIDKVHIYKRKHKGPADNAPM
ncbi:MAG: glycosyltransferase family 39 protein [Candidatus Omnitrophica bacterium]|nr:glycosyltransferase family 39 protein [Candidatus Omnitrophota bacterium]